MATLYTQKDKNITKTWFLMITFFVIVIAIGFLFAQIYGNPYILYIAVTISILMNIFSYWYSDKLVLRMTNAKEADPRQFADLHNIVENLAITAGLPKPRVYVIEDPAPNAFATGRDAEHAVVAATTGLLSILDKTELEGVIAHELSHIGNRDMLVSTVAVVLVGFVSIICDIFLRISFYGGNNSNRDGRAGAILMVLGLVAAILAPIAGTLIQLAISRKREFLADASGALLTRYPEGLASALQKISAYSRPMIKKSTATAHLFIANPLGHQLTPSGEEKVSFFTKLFMTHPPMNERVKALIGHN